MGMMSNCRSILVILAACCALLACSGNSGNTNAVRGTNSGQATATTENKPESASAADGEYPEAVVDEFLKSCMAAGSNEKFCACMLEKVQGKYSFEEFSVIEAKINAGTPPDEFVEFSGKARAACMK